MDYARLKNEAAAAKIVEAVRQGAEWNAVWSSVTSDDLVERTPESGPVFVPETAFKEQLAAFADLEPGMIGGPAQIASDDFFVGVKREKVEESTVAYTTSISSPSRRLPRMPRAFLYPQIKRLRAEMRRRNNRLFVLCLLT
jgi:hypothetical protein